MSSPGPERQLLHYRIINKVGEGGMGQVFRAEDTRLGRHVAIKLLSPDSRQDTIARRRLLAEAQSASVLNHPNVVTIYTIASGDSNGADEHFNAALAELNDYPAPLVAWKTYAGAARAKTATGDVYGGMEAASNASETVKMIAANVADEKLRETFVAAALGRLSSVTAT